jgi:hypothetical protein
VGEAAAEVIAGRVAGTAGEDLGFAGQAAEGARMQNAGGIAGEGSAVGMGRLSMSALREFAVLVAADGNSGRQRVGGFSRRVSHSIGLRTGIQAAGSRLVIPQWGMGTLNRGRCVPEITVAGNFGLLFIFNTLGLDNAEFREYDLPKF